MMLKIYARLLSWDLLRALPKDKSFVVAWCGEALGRAQRPKEERGAVAIEFTQIAERWSSRMARAAAGMPSLLVQAALLSA